MSYGYVVTYTRTDGTHGAIIGGHGTREQVESMTKTDIDYYKSVGYTIDEVHIKENCPACEGSGKVTRKKYNKWAIYLTDCRKCKGTGIVI